MTGSRYLLNSWKASSLCSSWYPGTLFCISWTAGSTGKDWECNWDSRKLLEIKIFTSRQIFVTTNPYWVLFDEIINAQLFHLFSIKTLGELRTPTSTDINWAGTDLRWRREDAEPGWGLRPSHWPESPGQTSAAGRGRETSRGRKTQPPPLQWQHFSILQFIVMSGISSVYTPNIFMTWRFPRARFLAWSIWWLSGSLAETVSSPRVSLRWRLRPILIKTWSISLSV